MNPTRWSDLLRRVGHGLHHAFSTREAELLPEEQALLDRAATLIARKGLAHPACLFLESSRPLSFLAGQTIAFLEPYLAGALGGESFGRLRTALEKRGSVDYLIAAIEREERAGQAPAGPQSAETKAPER